MSIIRNTQACSNLPDNKGSIQDQPQRLINLNKLAQPSGLTKFTMKAEASIYLPQIQSLAQVCSATLAQSKKRVPAWERTAPVGFMVPSIRNKLGDRKLNVSSIHLWGKPRKD
ncbi:hypothetical protein DSO57_1035749 [Entomophthora muscae]|uniref:Uncharacterized protein n=1 Tax=Entomophthora muscae TaxID=34485 RepID=A0ACC2S1L5_9FUNG|nr:hypothetical protein DSO57_1035749 [Entomophthora muscae]